MSWSPCFVHPFPREHCPDCQSAAIHKDVREAGHRARPGIEANAETAAKADELDRFIDSLLHGQNARTATEILDELIAECRGEVDAA